MRIKKQPGVDRAVLCRLLALLGGLLGGGFGVLLNRVGGYGLSGLV